MVFSLIIPSVTNAVGHNILHESVSDINTLAKAKVSERLEALFSDKDKVTFLVKFKVKADTTKVVQEVKESAKKNNISALKTEHIQRSAVVSALKANSLKEQQSVLDYLDEEVDKGNAGAITSYFIVNGIAVTATKEVAQNIAAFEEVEKILPNENRQLYTPNETDEKNEDITRPKSEGSDVEWNVEKVKAPEVWDKGINGKGIVVASLDTGVQWDHPALKEKYRGYNSTTEEVDHTFSWFDATKGEQEPYDDIGHGTHTVGTMVGSETNKTNQIGVAPGASWIAVKAFTEDGGTDEDLLAAAEWILAPTDADGNTRVDMAPDIVNNSWGGGPGLDEWYRDVVKEWRNANIFPVFSAGNVDSNNPGGPGSIASPANYPESFATGATDITDKVASFSLRGPSPYDEIKPDLSAPGQVIRSSVPGNGYAEKSGTSMAGPAVSGVAALLRSVDATISVDEMEETLLSTTKPLTDEAYPESPNNGYGYGLVDALNAVTAVNKGVGSLEGKVFQEEEGTNLPLNAQISIQGQGRSVNTDPEDGSYAITYAAGEYMVQAEAYGYYPEQYSVTFEKDKTVKRDFNLKEIPQRTINGTLTDEITGEAIGGATLFLKEDANITPVKTGNNGHYDLVAYEGDYTLKVIARGYYSKEIEITIDEDTSTVDLELKPFYGYPGEEIAYDDGTGEGGSWFHEAGNGWGVKMSLAEGQDQAMVTGGKFLFSKTGGDKFQVVIFDASGVNGAPGERIAGPVDATAIKNGEWTTVDLRDEGIVVKDDFYMVYMQSQDSREAPKLQQDKNGPFTERSWENYQGHWYQLESNFLTGNKMIRALVDYEMDTPVITSPEEDYITSEAEITVEGKATPTTKIQLMINGETVERKEVDDNGDFSIPATLIEGKNALTAVTTVDGKPVAESETVTITLDTTAPKLTIDSPGDNEKLNRETVTVEGTVLDEQLDFVEVNGKKATVQDGSYSKRILLDNGENVIEVVAHDKVGNTATENVTIQVKYLEPGIENLTPAEDVHINAGESVKIEFDSEPGLNTTFVIHLPLTNATSRLANATELPMMETSAGHYVGYWTATKKAYAKGAVIEVKAVDDFKNVTHRRAQGKLFINVDEE